MEIYKWRDLTLTIIGPEEDSGTLLDELPSLMQNK